VTRPPPAPITHADFVRACEARDPFRLHGLCLEFLAQHRHARAVELRALQVEHARLEKLRMAKAALRP
jgi:hypothetical protein